MQTQSMQVPLSQLKIDPTANVRQTPRRASAEWMNSLLKKGLIEPLIVRKNGAGYLVMDGGERLVNLQALADEKAIPTDYAVRVEVREETDADARDTSLMANIVRKDMHPIERHRAFARQLKEGRTEAELVEAYTMTPRQVKQALALGALAIEIQDAWLAGQIGADVAKAFTRASDQKAQLQLFGELKDICAKEDRPLAEIDVDEVNDALKVNTNNAGRLVHFVGVEAYIKRGGKVAQDLFGSEHTVSDPKLAKAMADEKLQAECKRLLADGWSFAVLEDRVGNARYQYGDVKPVDVVVSEAELAKLTELAQAFTLPSDLFHRLSFEDMDDAQQQAWLAHRQLSFEIDLRGYTPALRGKSGCFVSCDHRGLLSIKVGKVKPAERKAAEQTSRAETKKAASTAARAAGKPAPEPKEISQALRDRLQTQLTQATLDAIGEVKAPTPFLQLVQQLVAQQILPNRHWGMPDVIRNALPNLRVALGAALVNPAIAKRFDAPDYFAAAPKAFVLKAIAEGVSTDEARKRAKGTSAELAKFALHNLAPTGWLPKELRTTHYAGPGTPGWKRPAAAKVAAPAKAVKAKKTAKKKRK